MNARLITCTCLAILGWAGAILGDGSQQWLVMIFILWGASGAVFAYPYVWALLLVIPARRSMIHVADIRQDYFTMFWLRVERYLPQIRRLRERYANILRDASSNIPYDHDVHARRAIHLALTLTPLCMVSIIHGSVLTMPLAAAPAVALYPWVQLRGLVKQHGVMVQEEMAFFLCYLTAMQGVGYTLYTALERMRDAPDVFVAIGKDASSVMQSVMLGRPHMEALREYARKQTVEPFKDFLHGYISKHETVGPVPSYTEAKSEQFFTSYKETWENYKNSAIMMAAMTVMVSVMIPIMMVMMIFIAPSGTVSMMLVMGPMLGPIFAMLLLFMVDSSQPSTGVRMRPWLPALGVAAGVIILVHTVWMHMLGPGAQIWDTQPGLTVSLGFVAGGLANYIFTRRHLSGASNVDRGLPEFLGDIYEQTIAGTAISAILRQQARGGLYTGLFGRLLDGIVSKLEMGGTMEDSCKDAREHSRHLAFVLFVIIRLQELGSTANTPAVMRQMTKFMANVVQTKISVEKSLRMGAMMVYISPVILIGIMSAMLAVFAESHGASSGLANILPPGVMDGFSPPDPDSGYRERLGLMAALLTCPMGLVAAKITKFTAVHTMPVVIVGTVNVVSMILVPMLVEALGV